MSMVDEGLPILLQTLSSQITELRLEMNHRFSELESRICSRCAIHDERIGRLERWQAKLLGALSVAIVLVNIIIRWVWPK